MPTKRIVVLANSVKHDPGRCIAGREIIELQGGTFRASDWVRPVSTVGEGELQPAHTRVSDGKPVQVLDIFNVPLLTPAQDPSQPENWIVDAATPWTRVGQWPQTRLDDLVESPQNLWLQPAPMTTDRATAEYIQANPPLQSLYFLKLGKASLHRTIWGKHRLSFDYRDGHYDFGVTDPVATARQTRGDLTSPYVCVSLAPPFKGHHYKVAATVLW